MAEIGTGLKSHNHTFQQLRVHNLHYNYLLRLDLMLRLCLLRLPKDINRPTGLVAEWNIETGIVFLAKCSDLLVVGIG